MRSAASPRPLTFPATLWGSCQAARRPNTHFDGHSREFTSQQVDVKSFRGAVFIPLCCPLSCICAVFVPHNATRISNGSTESGSVTHSHQRVDHSCSELFLPALSHLLTTHQMMIPTSCFLIYSQNCFVFFFLNLPSNVKLKKIHAIAMFIVFIFKLFFCPLLAHNHSCCLLCSAF